MKTHGRRAADDSDAASPSAASSRDTDDYVTPSDVLFRNPSLPYGIETTVLGIPTRFRTNSRRVFAMFEDAFGAGVPLSVDEYDVGHELFVDGDASPRQLRVQAVVYDGTFDREDTTAVHHICPDPVRVLVHGPGGMAIADPLRREALIYASDGLVRDEAHFRRSFLEAATLALATHFDRQPIHAAAIGRDGRTVLLVGPSGAGKSTLAYLAHATGLAVLSEDIVWVQLTPGLKVWATPRAIHLLPGAEIHFPELQRERASRQPNGKHKMTVRLDQADDARSTVADSVEVCLLQPGGANARLARVERDQLHLALTQDAGAGFDRYPERRAECARVLAANGGWRLTLSTDPHDALPLLEELLRHGGS